LKTLSLLLLLSITMANCAARTPESTAGPGAAPTGSQPTPAQPQQQPTILTGIGILGDSFYDEYRADDDRGGEYAAVTLNSVELLVRLRGLNFGAWGTWNDVRRTGYEYNWARSGATSGSMIHEGRQHLGLAEQIRQGKVTFVWIGIGANDFSPYYIFDFQRIYEGELSGRRLENKINRAIEDVTLAVNTVKEAGAQGIVVTLFTRWDLDPKVRRDFPDPEKLKRVTDAIEAVNDGIRRLEEPGRVIVFDQNRFGEEEILPRVKNGYLRVGWARIDFNSCGDEPHHYLLSDCTHTGTVVNGLVANNYFIRILNEHFDAGITPLSDEEILLVAGIQKPLLYFLPSLRARLSS